MKTNEITLTEAAMNPSEFGNAIAQSENMGVLVGFEFEFCFPKKKIQELFLSKFGDSIDKQVRHILSIKLIRDKVAKLDIISFSKIITSVDKKPTLEVYKNYIDSVLSSFINEYNKTTAELLKLINGAIYNKYDINNVVPLGAKFKWLNPILQLEHRKQEIQYIALLSDIIRTNLLDTIFVQKINAKNLNFKNQARKLADAARFALSLLKTADFITAIEREFGNVSDDDYADNYTIDHKGLQSEFRVTSFSELIKNPGWYEMGAVMKMLCEKYLNTKPILFNYYHERKKDSTHWYIEPDGSLRPTSEEISLEFVSPPMKPRDAIQALQIFYQMASDYEFRTSKERKTGCHINVSIPDKIDLMKLALFTGDQYILQQFGREKNSYARSVYAELKSKKISSALYSIDDKFTLKTIADIAERIMNSHSASISAESDKKFISFRGVGSDYLSQFQNVANATARFVRSMMIASDPTLYRDDYLKKLYTLLKKYPSTTTSAQRTRKKVEQIRTLRNTIESEGIPVLIIDAYVRDGAKKLKDAFTSDSSFLYNLIPGNTKTNVGFIVQVDKKQEVIDNLISAISTNQDDVKYYNSPWDKDETVTAITNSADGVYRVIFYPKTMLGYNQFRKRLQKGPDKSLNHIRVQMPGSSIMRYYGWRLNSFSMMPGSSEFATKLTANIKAEIGNVLDDLKKTKTIRRKLPESVSKAPIYYFAYGMLTSDRIMNQYAANKIGSAALSGYKFELLGHANVIRDNQHTCQGVLWQIDAATLQELDALEGYPDYYTRKKVRVVSKNKTYNAWVYTMTDSSRANSYEHGHPSNNYVNTIAAGYRSAGMSLNQLNSAIKELNSRFEEQ
jgi:gamma-glutamylcyclotransferase (GGCT)/AIG2-like uncharacterized protein YtfP